MPSSLSLLRRNRHWRGLSIRLDPEALPCEIDLAPPRWALWLIVAIGLVWTLFALVQVGDLAFDGSLLGLAGLLFPTVGLVMVGYGGLALRERRRATFGGDGVSVEGRSLGGAERWSLPYCAYRGVLHREHVVRRKNGSTTYQIIELLHDDPDRTLPLSVEAATETPRARWEAYARAFGLPALEHAGGELVARAAGDLDKSLRTLSEEGKVAHRFDPDAQPPKGLSLAHEAGADRIGGERLRVTISAPRAPLWMIALFAGIAGIVFAGALWAGESPVAAAIPGVVLIGVGLVYRFDRRNPRQLVITRKAVTLIDVWQGTGPNGKTLKSDRIETVSVKAARPDGGGKLVIAGDRASLSLGSGLSRPALDWLAAYLTAAVIEA